MCGDKRWMLAGALSLLLCLTACAAPQPQQESASPAVTQTQEMTPQETETPVIQEETVSTVGVDSGEIPNEDVEFGE